MRTDTTMPKSKSFLSNSTKFTLCVYWDYKADGTPYANHEKLLKLNRKYIDSYDYSNTANNKTITDHYEAFWKLVTYAQRNIKHIGNAVLYCNDFVEQKQYKVGLFSNNADACRLVLPQFMKSETAYGIEHIYLSGWQSPVLDTYELVQRVLTKQPININQLKKAA